MKHINTLRKHDYPPLLVSSPFTVIVTDKMSKNIKIYSSIVFLSYLSCEKSQKLLIYEYSFSTSCGLNTIYMILTISHHFYKKFMTLSLPI